MNDMTLVEKWHDRGADRTPAENIVFKLLDELNGRRGVLGVDECDEEIQEEILTELVSITEAELNG